MDWASIIAYVVIFCIKYILSPAWPRLADTFCLGPTWPAEFSKPFDSQCWLDAKWNATKQLRFRVKQKWCPHFEHMILVKNPQLCILHRERIFFYHEAANDSFQRYSLNAFWTYFYLCVNKLGQTNIIGYVNRSKNDDELQIWHFW